MGSIIALMILVISVMLIFFKNDILNKNASSNKVLETSGFVVCSVMLVVIYIMKNTNIFN